jgi:uncharacterized damage-inducible protein DinB
MTETVERIDPPQVGDERALLTGFLAYHRATLAQKCAGLSPDQLRERAVPPSSLSLLGLVRHMAEVERGWFRRFFAGEGDAAPPRYYSDSDPDGDFDNVDDADIEEGFAFWREECEYADEVVGANSLDDVRQHPRYGVDISLRWVLVHMVEEYARHNGHADFLRERLDGVTGD